MPNKVTLHRVLTASPEKVFKAFAYADALASWLPPYGFNPFSKKENHFVAQSFNDSPM